MPRPEVPIKTVGPMAAFAQRLRDLRDKADLKYASMAQTARFSISTLAAAARGQKMPSWPVTEAFITACGVWRPEELRQWHRDWAVAVENAKMVPDNRRLTDEEMPDPRQVRTYDDLLKQLGRLKIAAGNLPYRSFYQGAGPANGKGPAQLPTSTISDLFTGRHVGRIQVFMLVVEGLVNHVIRLYGEPAAGASIPWHDIRSWVSAWRRALAHRDQHRRKPRTDDRQEGLAGFATWMAQDDPALVAKVLAQLDPMRRERVLQDLPLDVAALVHQAAPTSAPTRTDPTGQRPPVRQLRHAGHHTALSRAAGRGRTKVEERAGTETAPPGIPD